MTNSSPNRNIVHCLRVAKVLTDQVYSLMTPTTLGPEELAELTSNVGHLYPEMWLQLDTARNELVARGMDVSRYDAIREMPAARAPAMLGEVDEISLNLGGVTLAIEAVFALRALLPDVDWLGLDQAEEAELAGFSLRPAAWKRVLYGAFVVIFTICGLFAVVAMRAAIATGR